MSMNPLRLTAAFSAVLVSTIAVGSDARASCEGDPDDRINKSLCAIHYANCSACETWLTDLALAHVVSEHPSAVAIDEILRSDGVPTLTVGETLVVGNSAGAVGAEVLLVIVPRDDMVGSYVHLIEEQGIRVGTVWMSLDSVRAYATTDPPCESGDIDLNTWTGCDDSDEGLDWGCASGRGAVGGAGVLLLAMAWMVGRARRRRRT
ncbi:MAG: hypothetical protein EP329_24710 [Deltaproteobacteria bacterium]|nr:MAG: hypothetical protein EP329_24710 [Deltaproteobacteria bacterium]